MSSFFGNPENIRQFYKDFDLLGDQSESTFFTDVCAEIESLYLLNINDYPFFAAFESLLTALGDDKIARDLISENSLVMENTIFRLRLAAHLKAMGLHSDASEELRSIMHEEHRDLIGKLGEILSAGRLNEQGDLKRLWSTLIAGEELIKMSEDASFQQSPEAYTLLPFLPFREQIEGINLLIREEISAGLEKEVYAFVKTIHKTLAGKHYWLYNIMSEEGATYALPAFPVITVIARRALDFLDEWLRSGLFTTAILKSEVEKSRKEIFNHLTRFLVTESCIQMMIKYIPEPAILLSLRELTRGDDNLISEQVEILMKSGFYHQGRAILDILLQETPSLSGNGDELHNPESLQDTHEEPVLQEIPDIRNEQESEIYRLLEKGKEDEALTLLIENIRNRVIFEDYEMIFILAGTLGRFEELLPLFLQFKEAGIHAGVFLIRGYEQIVKKDIRGGLTQIDHAVYAGFPREKAMFLSAVFLEKAHFPKRAIGICERLLKKKEISLHDIYPVMIRSYRMQGRIHEAEELEKKTREPGSE